ncbi:MAG: NAD-dependent epimerase/dehydratase family protein [Alphaproteobacteria bacterium]
MQTVLVTGGAGFIGSHSVDKLIANSFEVVVVDRAAPTYPNTKATYYQCDMNDSECENIFQNHQIDFVLHLGAQAAVAVSNEDPMRDMKDNIQASLNIFLLCKKYNIKKVVVSSSAALYASPEYLPIDEKHPISFLSPYAVSKHTMEEYLKVLGLNYIIFRYANVYGPRQDPYGEAGVIAIFIDKINNNQDIQIHDDGEQTRDFIYVEDVANANVAAILSKMKNQTINVSTNQKTSINQLFNTLKEISNYNKSPTYTPRREGDIKHSYLDNQKLQQLLNIIPKTNLTNGLQNTIKGI